MYLYVLGKPSSREGSRDRSSVPQKSGSVGKDNVDKNKRAPSVNNKDKNAKPENSVPRPGYAGLPVNQKQSTNTGVPGSGNKSIPVSAVGTSSLPPDQSAIKPVVVPKPREPTPPDDPTLPTKYLDITQFKAPEDMEGEEELQAQAPAESANPNPDMNQLTLMLQQGMSIDEVAKTMNIKLDEQTYELLSTLKQQLDLASALAEQSAISQSSSVQPDQGEVGKTYDYSHGQPTVSSVSNYSNDIKADVSNVAVSGHTSTGEYSQSQDGSFYDDNSRDPYSGYDNRNMTLCNDAQSERTGDGAFRDKSADYSGYGSDVPSRPEAQGYGDFGQDSVVPHGPDSGAGYNRYGDSDSRPGAQKQYSYGSDNGETVQPGHRNSSSSSFSTGSSGPPGLLSSPPFRKSDSVPGFGRQHSDEGKYSRGRGGMGRKSPSFAGGGHYGRGGGPSGGRPLMMMDSGRGRGRGDFNRGQYKGKW